MKYIPHPHCSFLAFLLFFCSSLHPISNLHPLFSHSSHLPSLPLHLPSFPPLLTFYLPSYSPLPFLLYLLPCLFLSPSPFPFNFPPLPFPSLLIISTLLTSLLFPLSPPPGFQYWLAIFIPVIVFLVAGYPLISLLLCGLSRIPTFNLSLFSEW